MKFPRLEGYRHIITEPASGTRVASRAPMSRIPNPPSGIDPSVTQEELIESIHNYSYKQSRKVDAAGVSQ